jgi:cation diffusion facilitator CzcD-associated flavoprotein CzcO
VTRPVVVVGGGPAGLATTAELLRRRMPVRLLERGDVAGWSWEHLYDSLRLHTGRHMSALPRLPFPRGTPLFPSRTDFLAYLRSYQVARGITVETRREVARVARDGTGWRVTTADGEDIAASAVVMCTGIMANPQMPLLEGRERFAGRVLHSVDYRRPAPFAGQRVLVVGVGNSGGEIGSELADAGAQVTVVVRSGAHVVPLTIAGVPIQYLAYGMRTLPRPAREWLSDKVRRLSELRRGPAVLPRPSYSVLDAIPLIGFHLVDAIRAGRVRVQRGGIRRFTATGVEFDDGSSAEFDTVILATGFRAALASLGDQVTTDARGFARRADRITSADAEGLYFVGHNYDATGGLANIARDSLLVAARLATG